MQNLKKIGKGQCKNGQKRSHLTRNDPGRRTDHEEGMTGVGRCKGMDRLSLNEIWREPENRVAWIKRAPTD